MLRCGHLSPRLARVFSISVAAEVALYLTAAICTRESSWQLGEHRGSSWELGHQTNQAENMVIQTLVGTP